MKRKNTTFAPMNMVIKGTPASIQAALAMPGMPTYTLREPIDKTAALTTAHVIYEVYHSTYIQAVDIPFAAMPDVKFLMLGDGGDYGRSDGTWAIYKEFGAKEVAFCDQFTWNSIHQEEFQDEIAIDVWESFLDEDWSYEYEDYSCGETLAFEYTFKIAHQWADDSALGAEAVQSVEKEALIRCDLCERDLPEKEALFLPWSGEWTNDEYPAPERLALCSECRESLLNLPDFCRNEEDFKQVVVSDVFADDYGYYICGLINQANNAEVCCEDGRVTKINDCYIVNDDEDWDEDEDDE